MYEQGPRFWCFKDDLEMLRAEFGGLCAYCGKPSSAIVEREHILPQANFFLDSYLNMVPACPYCNRMWKAKASPSASGLRISVEAYQAYSEAIWRKNSKTEPLYLFHTIKKGILKLMTREDRVWEKQSAYWP